MFIHCLLYVPYLCHYNFICIRLSSHGFQQLLCSPRLLVFWRQTNHSLSDNEFFPPKLCIASVFVKLENKRERSLCMCIEHSFFFWLTGSKIASKWASGSLHSKPFQPKPFDRLSHLSLIIMSSYFKWIVSRDLTVLGRLLTVHGPKVFRWKLLYFRKTGFSLIFLSIHKFFIAITRDYFKNIVPFRDFAVMHGFLNAWFFTW